MYSKHTLLEYFDQVMSWFVPTFREDIDSAMEKHSVTSQIVDTTHGQIEYAIAYPELVERGTVLIAHTAVGGYDQSLATGQRFKGYQIIAPSRAGYLRTPITTGETPDQMADAYAGLLDNLKIDQVVMVGLSAGGMSATQFAIGHPDRCIGLILGAAITSVLPAYVLDILAPLSLANESDFINWVVNRVGQATAAIRSADKETQTILKALLNTSPTSTRWAGYRLDMQQARHFNPNLELIQCPTLLIHGTADWVVPYSMSESAHQRILNAELLPIQGGQHDSPILSEIVPPVIDLYLHSVFDRD